MPSLSVLQRIIHSILILVVCFWCPTLNPHHTIWCFLYNFFCIMLLSFSSITLLRSILAISLNFFYPHLILAVTASYTPSPALRASPRYNNFAKFSIALSSIATFLLTLVLSIKPEHFLHPKISCSVQALLVCCSRASLCIQLLDLMHKLVSFPFFHTEHGNLDLFIVLLPVQKAFVYVH